MFGELTKILTTQMAGQFGWLAVGLAIVPLGIVLASHWFWKESQRMAPLSKQFSEFREIASQRYLAKCSDTLQVLIGDPISATRKFLYRSGLLYLAILIFTYFIVNIYNSKIELSLIFPSKLDDFIEFILSTFLGYFIFLFCLSQSILFLDLCKSSRSSWQVFYALIADILLTFAAVAIFSGIIDTSYTWSVYGHEKRFVSLKILPSFANNKDIINRNTFEIETRGIVKKSDLNNVIKFSDKLNNSDIVQDWPILFAIIYQIKSDNLLQKEKGEFDTFYQFEGYKKLSDIIEIETGRLGFSSSLKHPISDIVNRMKEENNSCSPFNIENISIRTLSESEMADTTLLNANVFPNLKSIDFVKMLRVSVAHQLQWKWNAIASGSLYSIDNYGLTDLRSQSILTDECFKLRNKSDQLFLFRDDIFSSAFYNELNSDRNPFWIYHISSFYYSLACLLTSILLVFVMIGLLFVNLYNTSSRISKKILSYSIFEDISLERISIANAIVLGIVIFCTTGILRGLLSVAIG